MFSYAIRITLSYDDCKDVISKWADRSARAIVYQHDIDEEVSKTHIHLALVGCEVKAEALKRMWPDAPGKGNEFWSWKQIDDGLEKYVTYMTKGKLRPVFVKNFSQDIVDGLRQAWVEPSLGNDKFPADHTERVIQKVLQKFDRQTFKTQYHIADMDDDDIGIGVILQQVRTEAFRQLWGEHRRVPHASHYKIVAGSAFMRLCERLNRLDEGMEALQNLWY